MLTLDECLADDILRCPITHTPLRKLSPLQISEINRRIDRGDLAHYDGSAVRESLEQGLIAQDGAYVYPVVQDVIVLLPSAALELEPSGRPRRDLQKHKRMVRDHYDRIGWQVGNQGEYADVEQFSDTRRLVRDYHSRCGSRLFRYLKPEGRYLLDVGSGPAKDRIERNYSRRICVDLSFRALQEAKKRLGERGVYLLADATNLPLRSDSLDAAVSLHAIYHIPAAEQKRALAEIHRVLRPHSSAVVIYSWGHQALLMSLFDVPIHCAWALKQLANRICRCVRRTPDETAAAPRAETGSAAADHLYFHAHDVRYFNRANWDFDLEITVWSSLSIQFTRTYIRAYLFGEFVLRGIFWLEDRFPRFFRRWGQYPLLVIRKS
ncbi:MAG: class I SAM-dependent methyltransferase [Sedimentisphaerales bacterium]|nr:class I SAM-dependent methyltransferase [Sedimentisphaerales bacterium]